MDAAVLAVVHWSQPGAMAALAGGVIYVAGMFVVTMAFNVPLNNALAAVDPGSAEAERVWTSYLAQWTFWNHVRTLASVVASALFVHAIAST